MEEIDQASSHIKGEVDSEAEIFWGVVFDDAMRDEVQITVIATGIDKELNTKVVKLRDVTPEEAQDPWTVRAKTGDNLDVPTFQRINKDSYTIHREETKKSFFKRGFFKDSLDYPTFLRAKAD
jgi:cell division GTPase FtsZ